MSVDLVFDIGNSRIKGAFFKDGQLFQSFAFPAKSLPEPELFKLLEGKEIGSLLLSSVNPVAEEQVKNALSSKNIPFSLLSKSEITLVLDVEEKDAMGSDRIANCYGALHYFPQNDCIIVDFGTAVVFDYVTKDGHYLGGAIYPSFDISAKALSAHTHGLPYVPIEKPSSALEKTTKGHIQSGIYFGMLGAIERIIFELRSTHASPSSVQVIATGGYTQDKTTNFISDLSELVDRIDPDLTLIGLYEILKEKTKKQEK
jgi:type III pantothenate kinase